MLADPGFRRDDVFMSKRLDEELVARGICPSRSRARDVILRGTVTVNGELARKPSQTVQSTDELRVDDVAKHYVSRAALKLLHGLAHFNITVKDRDCLDIGASTGGFTQVLLEGGAAHVTAVDVGHGQMVEKLAASSRVTVYEGLNARDMTREHVAEETTLIVSDVSFISLRLALPPALELVPPASHLIALVKPQFEVGRENVGRGGIVTDPAQHQRVCNEISAFLVEQGWTVLGVIPVAAGGW